ncbi:MAG: hypothetical protein PHD13_00585 [Methanocellales archaeon]|nr:hypothetical protein [Methanocellales archaeon]MDD3291447.1 hypothetical protein [Methanocellales archaeon]MDD5234663.1 hypothetical protein [Methanocellales archaeon]
MKYEHIKWGTGVLTLFVFFVVLLWPFFPVILQISSRYGPLYALIGRIALPLLVGMYGWWSRKIPLVLVVSFLPFLLLFMYDIIIFGIMLRFWIYSGICLSLIGMGAILINSNKKLGFFLVIVGVILWIMLVGQAEL